MRRLPLHLAVLAALLLAASPVAAAEHRLGIGAHYWRTVDDLVDDRGEIEDDGLSWIGSYQYVPGIFRLEIDVEYFDAGFGGATEEAFAPQAFLLVGAGVYGGLGIGVTYSSGFEDDVSDPFYAARVGLDYELLPGLHLDLNANYRFEAWSELEGADTDTVTLGAIARVAF